jgi:hypothetical protein
MAANGRESLDQRCRSFHDLVGFNPNSEIQTGKMTQDLWRLGRIAGFNFEFRVQKDGATSEHLRVPWLLVQVIHFVTGR